MQAFFATDGGPQAFVLAGGPGIGKTTLWEAGANAARERGLSVLSARPSDAEAQLSFTALTDLLEGIDTKALADVPAPQLHALEVAVLRAEPADAPPEPRAIALGFLNALRALAAREPLLVAVDDVQWLDSPSADALAFAGRRLRGQTVRFLLAKRTGTSSVLEPAFEPNAQRLEVGPLSLGATRRLLSERLALTLPRRVLRRVFDSAAGNPLFALELGRTLADRELPEIGEDMPVPDLVEDLLGKRVEQLPDPVRRLLLAVALSADLRSTQLEAIAGAEAVENAVDAGVLLVDGDRVRPSHPLLAAAAKGHSHASERRELHLELAGAVADDALRARHLALATDRPNPELAATVAAAAVGASARGAVEEAVELAEHALRLTPPDSAERSDRVLAVADYLLVAGHMHAITELLTGEVGRLPPGVARGRAHLLLAAAAGDHDVHEDQVEQALSESEHDPGLRAAVLAHKWGFTSAYRLERIGDADTLLVEALEGARKAGPTVERDVLLQLGWARILRGRPIDNLSELRFHRASDAGSHIYASLDRLTGIRLAWRGDSAEARAVFTELLSLADERGEALSYIALRLQLCELELRTGRLAEASRLLEDWEQSHEGELAAEVQYHRCRAVHAAVRGLPEEAERWAAKAIEGVRTTAAGWDLLEASRARGIAALLAHEPARAAESLRAVWEHTQREGVEDPGAFPAAPDLVEALVELGELGEASAVTDRLKDLAEQQEHRWGLATAQRCAALVRLASRTYDEEAAESLEQSAAAYEQLGFRFDRARTLLVLGRAQRRFKKWGAARHSLEAAAAAFDEMGATGWAEQTQSDLARVGARKPRATGELTPSERRVCELAADGLSNKEIAQALFVTVHTVEVHLSHAYAKLGVRSRSQLAGRLKD